MEKDTNRDEYPKLTENDKRLKNQEEFDSSGVQRQLEDEDNNASITELTVATKQDNNRDGSSESPSHSKKDQE